MITKEKNSQNNKQPNPQGGNKLSKKAQKAVKQ